MSLRARLYEQMEPSARSLKGLSLINLVIVILVVLSFLTLALETEETLSAGWKYGLAIANIIIVCVFAIEYIARFWVAGEDPEHKGVFGRLRYMFSFYAMADLVAFLPELLWLLFAPPEADQSMLLALRITRLARLVKIARFVPAFDVLGAAMRRAGSQLLTTLAMALVLVYISAVALYFIEGVGQDNEAFASIPRSIWWAVATLTTVGYGDVYPVTTLGRIAASIIAIAGVGVVALPAGVFASAFSDELRELENARLKEQVEDLEDTVEDIVEELEAETGNPEENGA